MNCYEFEKYISEYIDGNLKIGLRKSFLQHKSECSKCDVKINDITFMIKEMKSQSYEKFTSKNFLVDLEDKIKSYEINSHIIKNNFFGFDYMKAFGIAAAFVMLIGASYTLIVDNKLPTLDLEKYSNSDIVPENEKTIKLEQKNHIATADDSLDSPKKEFDMPIHLVGRSN